ncbi:RNase adapter RapZ [Nanchangia anserum]|uniref:RNase adapter RapZ n=1 Tax=Nanchangia anserum TaxID=2692125 RepID=A0A8I0KMY8_9ACTO|nr:RNase adapter RapZ [Nanchangia anserum]MBD3688716.1 RNase adapter RapZ [Nanchangia anserum]QOX82463.1 RNase adapter RapZ [Nanchangia anserum]
MSVDPNDSALSPPTVPEGVPQLDADQVLPTPHQPELLIITGMSGAGRSRAAQALEDLDWYVVDNLPPHMLIPFADLMTPDGGGVHRLAAVVDARSGEFFDRLAAVLDDLQVRDVNYRIVFLDADDDTLVRRYESNRRPHPMQDGGRIMTGISRERALLAPVRSRADVLIDSSHMNVHDLARHMRDVVAGETEEQVRLTIMSFGFKHGIPLDADWVADMRYLQNPYWIAELRHLTGLDAPVADYVLNQPGAKEFGRAYVAMLTPILDGFARELKPFITVAIGCTGGRHRSVAMTEFIAAALREKGLPVRTLHRDMGKA